MDDVRSELSTVRGEMTAVESKLMAKLERLFVEIGFLVNILAYIF